MANNLKQVRRQMHHAGNGRNDPFELEVRDLARMFRGANHSLRKIFQRLRHVRNKLAHQEHLTLADVLNLIKTPSPVTLSGVQVCGFGLPRISTSCFRSSYR